MKLYTLLFQNLSFYVFVVLRLNSPVGKLYQPREHQMAQLAVEEKQQLHHREAGVDTDWDTTEIYFLKEVHLLVLPGHHLTLHPRPAAVTETALTKDTDAGVTLIILCAS